jgi:AraC-like DNA-binding protein
MHPSITATEQSEANARQIPAYTEGKEQRAAGVETLGTLAAECNYNAHDLAKRMGLSHRQLQRSFQTTLQCSPRDWLREQRLQRARYLLGAAASVKQVAYALGFSQESQFCRDFKARFGFTPSKALPVGKTLLALLAEAKQTMPLSSPPIPPPLSRFRRGAKDETIRRCPSVTSHFAVQSRSRR